jgi:hypothetical protein
MHAWSCHGTLSILSSRSTFYRLGANSNVMTYASLLLPGWRHSVGHNLHVGASRPTTSETPQASLTDRHVSVASRLLSEMHSASSEHVVWLPTSIAECGCLCWVASCIARLPFIPLPTHTPAKCTPVIVYTQAKHEICPAQDLEFPQGFDLDWLSADAPLPWEAWHSKTSDVHPNLHTTNIHLKQITVWV